MESADPPIVVRVDRGRAGWSYAVPELGISETPVSGGFRNLRSRAVAAIASHPQRPTTGYRVELELTPAAITWTTPQPRTPSPGAEPPRPAPAPAKSRKMIAREALSQRQRLGKLARELNTLKDSARALGVLGPVGRPPSLPGRAKRLQLLATRTSNLIRALDDEATSLALRTVHEARVLQQLIQEHIAPGSVSRLSRRTAVPLSELATPFDESAVWKELTNTLIIRLKDLLTADIRLTLAGKEPLPGRFAVDRVTEAAPAEPFCVAWTSTASRDVAALLARAGWALWRPDRSIEVRRWRGRTEPGDIETTGYLIATVRRSEAFEFSQTLVDAVRALDVPASSVSVRCGECSPEEYRRRMTAADVAGTRGRRRTTDDGRPILGYCLNCGQPLTDPVSAARGYGPVCRPRPGQRTVQRPPDDADFLYRVAGVKGDVWRAGVISAARTLAHNTPG